jgi:hypothetical protein
MQTVDIKFKSGKIFFRVDSQLAACLIEAGLAEQVRPEPPPAVVQARWSVGKGDGGTFIRIVCDRCRRTTIYTGRVEDIPRFEKSLCSHAGTVPDDVLADYEHNYTGNLAALPWS